MSLYIEEQNYGFESFTIMAQFWYMVVKFTKKKDLDVNEEIRYTYC